MTRCLVDPGLDAYGARLDATVRKRVYAPYVRELQVLEHRTPQRAETVFTTAHGSTRPRVEQALVSHHAADRGGLDVHVGGPSSENRTRGPGQPHVRDSAGVPIFAVPL